MKRFALGVLIVITVVAGSAMARNLPQQATIAVVNDLGTLVGTGTIHDGSLEIVLSDAANGFVTLELTDANGNTSTVQGLVSLDGSLRVVQADGMLLARDFAAQNALALVLTSRGTVEAQSAPEGFSAFE